ncbi:MAG: PAS domain S-box protein [bacterium]
MADSGSLYQTLVELCPDPMVVLQGSRYRLVSQAFVDLFGYSQEEVARGLSFMALVAQGDQQAFREQHQARLAGKDVPRTFRLNLIAKDGTVIPCETSARLIDYEGSPADLMIIRDISERAAAREALMESDAEYRQLFDNVLEGVYQTTPDGRILKANRALADILGYDSKDDCCRGVSVTDLYANPEERRAFLEQLERDGYLRNIEYRLKRKDGSVITVLENARVVRDKQGKVLHYEGILTDITRRIESQEDLKQVHAQLAATLDALPDMLFEMDREGRIYDFRAPDPSLLYRPPSEFLGKTMQEILPPPAAEVITYAVEKTISEGQCHGQVYALDIMGDKRWFECSMAIKGSADDLDCRIIALIHDITEWRRTEESLRRATNELVAERQALKDKNIALQQVLEHLHSKVDTDTRKAYTAIDDAIRPLLQRIIERVPPEHADEAQKLYQTLDTILTRDLDDFRLRISRLTSREAEICDMISFGMSSKEIADQLGTSPATVNKHRETARRKLGLTGQPVSLFAYLRSHRGTDSGDMPGRS